MIPRILSILLVCALIAVSSFWWLDHQNSEKQINELEMELADLKREVESLRPGKYVFGRRKLTDKEESEFEAWYQPTPDCVLPSDWQSQVRCTDKRKIARDEYRALKDR